MKWVSGLIILASKDSGVLPNYREIVLDLTVFSKDASYFNVNWYPKHPDLNH